MIEHLPEIKIDEAHERAPVQPARSYIGASNVGHGCEGYLAFSVRGFPDTKPPARLARIFKLGHRIEDLVVDDLRSAGYEVWERDPLTGRQFHYEMYGGHVACNADGQIEMERGAEKVLRLLEVKSMNDANHKKFKAVGVMRSHPRYYAQMQMEMGLSGIPECLFIAYNKNTSEYATEVVAFDAFFWAALQVKIDTVLANKAKKVATDESDWRCKGCFKKEVCWSGTLPDKACRTCTNAVADRGGGWWCGKHNRRAEVPCDDYQVYHPLPKE